MTEGLSDPDHGPDPFPRPVSFARVRLRHLNLSQRIVVVVALAGILRVLGSYVLLRFVLDDAGEGFFGYVPLTRASPANTSSIPEVTVWLVTIAVWACASLWLLGLPRQGSISAGDAGREPRGHT
jgi:hypothetical protein